MNWPAVSRRSAVYGLAFLLAATATCHVLFSWMGFNPTDDGVVLAAGRRLLDGQTPHRDFISIRPVGSSLLHLPALIAGGDCCIWLARLFVWLEFAAIAWTWTSVASSAARRPFSDAEKVLLSVIGLTLSAHTFPIMPWTTVDGLFLISCGLWLCTRCTRDAWRVLGYVIVGAACLCRQPFVVMIPAAIILLGDWRRVRYWLASFAPLALYVVYLWGAGALHDAIVQFAARSELVQTGFLRYSSELAGLWGAMWCLLAMWLLWPRNRTQAAAAVPANWREYSGALALYLLLAFCSARIGERTSFHDAFALFGGVLACTAYVLVRDRAATRLTLLGLLGLATAWCASLSLGYNSPALAAAVLVPFLAAYAEPRRDAAGDAAAVAKSSEASTPAPYEKCRWIATAAVAVLACVCFYDSRTHAIYRDQPVAQLTHPLDPVFPGGGRIRTGEVTFEFLRDLQEAVRMCGDKEHAVIPDLAAYWIRAAQRNPLSIDWAFEGELPTKPLMDRAIGDVESRRGQVVVIVQKIPAAALGGREPAGFPNLPDVRAHVIRNWRKVGETRAFELYE